MAHGSGERAATESIGEMLKLVAARAGRDVHVTGAFLGDRDPTVHDAVSECAARGVTEVVVHPYLLVPGKHASHDVPHLADACREAFPDIAIRVTAPLGPHPMLAELVLIRSGLG